MWKKRKAIDGVSQSSMVPLKAVLYEREEAMKTGSISADEQAAKRRKTDNMLKPNPGVAERAAQDRTRDPVAGKQKGRRGTVDRDQILREKAELYSQMIEQGQSTDGNGLVDVERKRWQNEDQQREAQQREFQDMQSSYPPAPTLEDTGIDTAVDKAESHRVLVALSDDTDSKRTELKADRAKQENAASRRREALKKREQLKQQQQQQQQATQALPSTTANTTTTTSTEGNTQASSPSSGNDTIMTVESKGPAVTTTASTPSCKPGVAGATESVGSSPRDDSPGVVSLKSPTPPMGSASGTGFVGSGRHRLGGQNPVTSPPPLITTSGRRGNANASGIGGGMLGEMGGKLTAGVPFVLTAGKVSPARRRSLRHIQMAHHGPSLVGSESACDTSMESLSPTRAMRSVTSNARRNSDNNRSSLSPVDDLVRRPQPGSSPLVRSALAKHNEEMEGRKRGEEASTGTGPQVAPSAGAGVGPGTGAASAAAAAAAAAAGSGEGGKKEGARSLTSPPASTAGTGTVMGSPPHQWTHPSWPPMRREDSASHMSMSSNMADNIDSLLGKTVNDLFGGAPFAPPMRRKRRGIVDADSRPAAPPRATPSKVLEPPKGREPEADSATTATAMSISNDDGQTQDNAGVGGEPDQV